MGTRWLLFDWKCPFFFLQKRHRRTDGPTYGPTDGRTDRPSYRDARTHLKMGFQSRATRVHKSPCRSVGRTVGLCSWVIFWQFWRPTDWIKLNQILTIHELLSIPTVSSVSHGFCPHQTRSCRRHQNRVRDGRLAKYSFARYSSFRKFPSYPLNLK